MKGPGRAWLAALLGLAACHEAPCGLERCDIRAADCQRQVAVATACLRGVAPVSVPMKVVPRKQFLDEAQMAAGADVDAQAFGHWITALSLFSLAKPDLTPMAAARADSDWVAAFYDGQSKSITIIDWGDPLDTNDAVTLLVHEYAHALQDQLVGLDAFWDKHAVTFDAGLAATSMLEGEATLVEDLAVLGLWGKPEAEVPWSTVLGAWQSQARRARDSSDLPVLLAPAHFRYAFGAGYAVGAYHQGGWPAVTLLHTEPPTSTRQVLAGPGASEPAQGPWRVDLADEAVPIPPARHALVGAQQLGSWIVESFIRRAFASDQTGKAESTARRLRGDVLSVFRQTDTGKTVAAWRLRFPEAQEATRLAQEIQDLSGRNSARAFAVGSDVVVLRSDDVLGDAWSPPLKFMRVPDPGAMPAATPRTATIACPRVAAQGLPGAGLPGAR